MGDPSKMIILEEVLKIIKQESLLNRVQNTGDVLMKGLTEYENKYPQLINSVRGMGTFVSFNLPSTAHRDKAIVKLKSKGE